MRWMRDHHQSFPEIGERGMSLAAAFSAERSADRWNVFVLGLPQ